MARERIITKEGKENTTRISPLHARLILANAHFQQDNVHATQSALNPAIQPSIPEEISLYNFSPTKMLSPLTIKERKTAWEGKSDCDTQWIQSMTRTMNDDGMPQERKDFLEDVFNIQVGNFTETTAQILLNNEQGGFFYRGADGERESNLETFCNTILNSSRYAKDGKIDGEILEKDTPHISWLAQIYGKDTAKLLLKLLVSDATLRNDLAEFENSLGSTKMLLIEKAAQREDVYKSIFERSLQGSPSNEDSDALSAISAAYTNEQNTLSDREKRDLATNRWINSSSEMYEYLINYRDWVEETTGNIVDSKELVGAISDTIHNQLQHIKENYGNTDANSDESPLPLWEPQGKVLWDEGTCYYSAAGNALRALDLFDSSKHAEEMFIKEFPTGYHGLNQDKAVVKILSEVADVTKTPSMVDIIEAVQDGAAAIVDLSPTHVGTIPPESKLFKQDGILMIRVIDPMYGPRNMSLLSLLRSDATVKGLLEDNQYYANLIIRKPSQTE